MFPEKTNTLPPYVLEIPTTPVQNETKDDSQNTTILPEQNYTANIPYVPSSPAIPVEQQLGTVVLEQPATIADDRIQVQQNLSSSINFISIDEWMDCQIDEQIKE